MTMLKYKHEHAAKARISPFLSLTHVKNVFIHRVLSDKPVNSDIFRLSYAVTPVLRLPVILRVEVKIMQDDSVGRGQVNAQSPRAS